MLFSSYEFILFFLPITLGVYFALGVKGFHKSSLTWLVICSLFYYGWWNPIYLWLIGFSIFFNYFLGLKLAKQPNKVALIVGIIVNLGFLGYFKYTNFFLSNISALAGLGFNEVHIILPLALSFFTFQQIAYLIDAYRGETHEYDFLQYTLFVTFFPQLIAGPIVHHKEMLPQFTKDIASRINSTNLVIGIAVFSIGLAKKVLIADQISPYANPVFSAAEMGVTISFFEAWGAALAYTLQLYFDFSGYADMAIGIGIMFGIKLPANFNSPYKAACIIDFWRRWHMTLSRFLRDYLYIALGGNRKGIFSRYKNLLLTMVLGGLWHGAAWNFVIWGALHGLYLIINHFWRYLCGILHITQFSGRAWYKFLATSITFLAVVFAWVFFRAESTAGAINIIQGMMGNQGYELPFKYIDKWGEAAIILQQMGVEFTDTLFKGSRQIKETLLLLILVFALPNTLQIMKAYSLSTTAVDGENIKLQFAFKAHWLIFIFLLFVISILQLGGVSDFLYFQF